MIKSLEDIMVKYDGTVRSANDVLIQLIYGDSGADTTKQYEYAIKSIESDNAQLENKYKFSSQELKNYKDFSSEANDKYFEELKIQI